MGVNKSNKYKSTWHNLNEIILEYNPTDDNTIQEKDNFIDMLCEEIINIKQMKKNVIFESS